MTAITLTTFLDRARKRGDYENSGVFTDELMTPWVNEAIGEYCDELDATFDGYRDTAATLPTVAGTATVALPAAFLKMRGVSLLYSGTYRALDMLEPSRQALGYDLANGRPTGYLHVGANLELFPTPDAVYTIRLRYVPTATVLSNLSDSLDVPNGWESFIIEAILLRCDEREERDLRDRKDSIERARMRIRSAAATRNVAGPSYLPLPGIDGGWRW